MHNFFLLLLPFFLVTSCANEQPTTATKTVLIQGRHEKSAQPETIYRAKIPINWEVKDSHSEINIMDTTLPLAEFFIRQDGQQIRVTIHNFPFETVENRIPANAQISRWKRQFQSLNSTATTISQHSFGGFSGLFLEAQGVFDGKESILLGWSMQLAQEHTQTLNQPHNINEIILYKQMRADYTIKVLGPVELMEQHKVDIMNFANSFEFILDLPS